MVCKISNHKSEFNREYLDYVMVKGASQQTIPLILLVPTGIVLGITLCMLGLVQNLRAGI